MLPPALSIFSGTKFVPVISILGSIVVGIILSFLWPFVQTGLSSLSLLIKSTGAINIFQAQLLSPTAMFDINVTRFM